MWFYDPNRFGIYFLTGEEERHNLAVPEIVPADAPLRPVDRDVEWVWDRFAGRGENGARVDFDWVCSPVFVDTSNAVAAKVEYPKQVTLKNLAAFYGGQAKKGNAIKLDDHATIMGGNPNTFYLNVDGNKVLCWTKQGDVERLTWYPAGIITPNQIAALKKYLGTIWKFEDRDGLAGLQSERGDWILATQYALFTIDGRLLNKDEYKDIANPILSEYARLNSDINKYVDAITPEKVINATQGMTGTTHSILTRCDGCQTCNGMHLEVHMARGDLDAYLIFSAYDAFGPEIYGGAVRNTWDLIADPSRLRVSQFKEIMRKFLLDTIRPKINHACFVMMERRQGSTKWQLFGNQKMYVDGGVRLVAGVVRRDNNEDGMRDGEWMAREAQEERQRQRFRGYPPARLRRGRPVLLGEDEPREGGVVLGIAPGDEDAERPWEPDPFDMDLDIEEDEI